ncbi:T7SS effector LXG polymorphic toxin [Niallia taxi]|uniref:deaminase domain-containing protein n=1 Tax=Niallia taxi TaxID=2499688 RepID=UPI0029349765|nr:deaminase domain-containing protein [Niallia taxi]WOD63532.1 T7SS effector LXG polymorphic toxin [Niallia taxi]
MKILDASSLQDAMEQRAKHYDKLRDQFTSLKRAFQEMIDLDDFEGKGAEAIKGFYQGQIEVVEAWRRLFDRQIAFFEGVSGKLEDKDLGSNSRVETAFLEEDLVQKERQADEMITEQRRALENIFRDIDDLVPLHPFSRSKFDDLMMDASKKRTKTIEAVEEIDQELKDEYMSSEGEEAYAIQLFSALLGATKQGSSISPIQFDAEAYHQSDIYKLKGEAEEATISYLTYKQQEQEAREIAERPAVEKVWDGVKTFVGEFTGYYDYKRAVEGVDPVTGEKMSTAQRIAAGGMALAGFIPIVGWAGRAVKGGKGIYSAAKGINAAENAMSTYKNVQAFSTLEKTEMGIYGLLSANGLSEYTTGKDMFGNELTAEQRQASLTQSIFAGLPFIPGMAKEAGKLGQQALNSTVQIGKQGADVSRAFMDDLGRSLHTGPNVAFAGGVGDVNSYLKAESRADGVGKVSGDKESYLSMLSGGSGDVVKGTGKVYPTRQIDSVTEAHIIDRVKELRGNLSSKYKKSGNFALAEVDVSGMSKSEFYAQSSINELKGNLEHKVSDISLQPKNPMFKATEAVGKNGFSYLRNTDTEYKILNDIASRLGENTQATGKIRLFTELDTCDSCNNVIAEFAAKYKNIELEVIHNNGNRVIP